MVEFSDDDLELYFSYDPKHFYGKISQSWGGVKVIKKEDFEYVKQQLRPLFMTDNITLQLLEATIKYHNLCYRTGQALVDDYTYDTMVALYLGMEKEEKRTNRKKKSSPGSPPTN